MSTAPTTLASFRFTHRVPLFMGLAHCPLCVALAVVSVLRCGAHALQLWQLQALPAA